MYMLLNSMYITCDPLVETRATPDDTVSVTLSRVCILCGMYGSTFLLFP